GLKEGNHEYRMEVNDAFFESLPFSEIRQGQVDVKVDVAKHSRMMTLSISMEGFVFLPCDRCSADYRQPVSGERKMVVNLEADQFDDEDDLLSLPASVHELDLSQYLYEYISLLVPSRRVCGETPDPSKGCDPEIIAALEKLKPGKEIKSKKKKKEVDPRWDNLKKIKFKN
ncbi:MAG TPA: DUF177 domain-containing protein, partial [Bacteroidia bacterium]|nr:DUF177 domain-containing protein [Bacteroidia bacterium]